MFNDAPDDMIEWVQKARAAVDARNQLAGRMAHRSHMPLTGMVSVEDVLHAHERELGRLNEDGQITAAAIYRLIEEHTAGLRYMINMYRENQYLHGEHEKLKQRLTKLENERPRKGS